MSIVKLPGFDPNGKCPKCGSGDVLFGWHPAGHYSYSWVGDGAALQEHMHRTCSECGYEWPEAPLDAVDLE